VARSPHVLTSGDVGLSEEGFSRSRIQAEYVNSFVIYFNVSETAHSKRPMAIHGMGLAAQQVLVPL